jgi:predicted nucleic acid-binding Zn finger protein
MEFIYMRSILNETTALEMAKNGLVKRTGDHFTIYAENGENNQIRAKVKRRDDGIISCTCNAFMDGISKESGFRCEHILAVKHAIHLKNTESFGSQPETSETVSNVLKFVNPSGRFTEDTLQTTKRFSNLSLIDPVAKTFHDLITGRQLAMIREFSKYGIVNPEKECEKLWGLMPNELSRSAASALIAYLTNEMPLAAKELNLKQAA